MSVLTLTYETLSLSFIAFLARFQMTLTHPLTRSLNVHMIKHSESLNFEPSSRGCPLCFRPRIEHKNREIKAECLMDSFEMEKG